MYSGYDSDVEREKKIDYATKIYVNPKVEKEGIPPHLQEQKEKAKYGKFYVTINNKACKVFFKFESEIITFKKITMSNINDEK